jgi:glutamate carboxypeptidase
MHPFLRAARARQRATIGLIRELVECESPSDDAAAVNRFVDLVASKLAGTAKIRTISGGRFGKHLRCEIELPGKPPAGNGAILALGHSDTVWPLGTLQHMPFREKSGRLWGPGVLDMKAGIAFFLTAAAILRDQQVPVARRVIFLLVSDEEVGSESSRPITEQAAKQAAAVLVLEPGTGLEGKCKTERKGVGDYSITVNGVASHAGLAFADGASAILELGRQLEKISTFTDLARGITVNPGVIRGGTRSNVVAAEARAEVDIRVRRSKDALTLDKKFHSLRPFDPRCSIRVEGGLNRPPMERTKAIQSLFGKARDWARELGVDLEESASGGGSDGNFTAGLGIPTLDGIGGVGEGAHAANESILVNRIADRTALLALLLSRL